MQKFSQNRTQYLFDNSNIDHGEGADNLQNRLNNVGIVCTSGGENTGAGHMTVSRIFNGRKKSNDHNELLLQASVQEIGLGVVRQKKGEELCSTRVLIAIGKD